MILNENDLIEMNLTKGLFVWARSTGLARFPIPEISMCSYEKAG